MQHFLFFICIEPIEIEDDAGRVELPKVVDKGEALEKLIKERRCDSQSRGSLYDSKAGKFFSSHR